VIIDLFAGPGGWDEGLLELGRTDVLGLEWDDNAAATRYAAGHRTWHTDIAAVTDDQIRALADALGPIEGLIGSPPCQGFSMAGHKKGLDDIGDLRRAIAACTDGWVDPEGDWTDDRSKLVLEPLRWAWLMQPEWIACEQVPRVLPLWKAMANVLAGWGYSVWTGVLNAADYGVPQTRERAILMAKRGPKDWLAPEPTHSKKGAGSRARWVTMAEALGWGLTTRPSTSVMSRHHNGPADPLDGGSGSRQVYADAQEAGDWEPEPGSRVGFPRLNDRDDGGEYRERDLRGIDEPAFALTEKARSWQVYPPDDGELAEDDPGEGAMLNTGRDWKPGGTREDAQTIDPTEQPAPTFTALSGSQWQLRSDRQANAAVRTGDQPAPTIAFGHAADDMVFQPAGEEHPKNVDPRADRERLETIDATEATDTPEGGEWAEERPATTLACDPRVFRPGGHHANDGRRPDFPGRSEGAMRIQPWQALALQSFRRDYPVQGTWSRQFEQIGNAVPPGLARAVLEPLLGLQTFAEPITPRLKLDPATDGGPGEQSSLFDL